MRRRIQTFDAKERRKRRVRSRMKGTGKKPRISVFRSNKYIYAQAIDDEKRETIATFSSLNLRKKEGKKLGTKTEEAFKVGEELGKLLLKKKIKEAVFDRGPYKYAGRVKNVAEGLRKAGIKI